MSVRIIIILLALPLFLLLAAVNSLLLYREDTMNMEAGLRAQALAAAVTVAEFARTAADPFADLARPLRLQAVRAAGRDIKGLDALYLSRPGQPPLNLLDRPPVTTRQDSAPARAMVLGTWHDAAGRPHITALAPAGQGAKVVADIDAEPLIRRAFDLKRLSIALVAGSLALAILLGLFVARRVAGEFRRLRAIIDAPGGAGGRQALAISEVSDLADAVHLIDASVAGELERLGGPAIGDPAIGIAAAQAKYFPDIAETVGDTQLSIRTLAGAPPGCFHLHLPRDGGAIVAIGAMDGAPAEALAAAVALRDHVLAGAPQQFEARLAAAGAAFGVLRASSFAVTPGETCVRALNAPSGALRDYAERNPALLPDALASDFAILFPDAGVIVAAKS
jgi:hypothetical protein